MSNLNELSREAIATLGGRAKSWQIAERVAAQMDADDYRDITWNGFVSQVRNALRAPAGNGLPAAVAVSGEYVQTALLDVEEYRVVVTGYMKRADANLDLARRFADECLNVHGVTIAIPHERAAS